MQIFSKLESEVRGYVRSFPTLFSKARGSFLYDVDGKEYIDFFAGAGSLNYGHNEPRLKKKMMDYLAEDGLVHGLDMASTAKKDFLETFERLILQPREFEYKTQFTGPTGTNAVEAAFKLARKITGRSNIVAFTNGFHGLSLGSLAATGNSQFRDVAGASLAETSFMPYDGYFGDEVDTIEYFERMLEDKSSGLDTPAAVIVETVQGEGGINCASNEWLKGVARLCREHEILLIVDDIQAGCGRTGTFFSFEPAGITPDMVTLSKSLSAFGMPMSIVLMRPELDQWEPSEHTGTFRGNNLAFVTASEALRLYWSDNKFAEQVQQSAAYLRKRLEEIASRHPGVITEVRGRGLMQGMVMEPAEFGSRVSHFAWERGVILETSGADDEVVKFLPALNTPNEVYDRGLKVVEEAIELALKESSQSGGSESEQEVGAMK